QSNSNSSLISASINDNTLTLDFLENQNGTADIIVTGISNSLEISDTFTITVNAIDDAPVVSQAISDVTEDEDADNQTIDLSAVFSDIDNDDSAITKSIQSNSNSSLISASINDNTLTLDFLENQNGTADITIIGTSNSLEISDTFTITVNAIDDAPVVSQAISDVTEDEDADNQTIDLSAVFSDIDNDDSAITKSIQSNSNSSLISASINDNTLTLDFLENQNGSAEIIITGTSNSQEISDTFTITVNAIDDAPVVSQAISDVTEDEDADNQTIDLSAVFSDIDNDDAAITKSIHSNSNSSLISASINDNTLTLDFLENQNGSAEIIITGTSNSQEISDTFTITVNAIDDAPVVSQAISDVTEDEDADNQTIDLSAVFSDIDNDDSAITKSIQSNSNSSLISASINDNTLTLDFLENQNGSAEIIIKGTSNGKDITDSFNIIIQAINDSPTITLIPSQEVYDTATSILTYTITDIETAPENLSVTLLSSNANVLPVLPGHVFMSGNSETRILSLTPVEGAYGTSMLTVVVMDTDNVKATSSFLLENIRPSFTIYTLADGNGCLSPSENISVLKGNFVTVSINPQSGNTIDDILVNGESIGVQSQYTFWSVAQDYTIKAIFEIIPAPVASFYGEPLEGYAPLIVDFINTSQNTISKIEWLFGDSSKSSASSPAHTYALPGSYTVCLRLTGPGGNDTLTKTAYIEVKTACDLNVQFSADQRIVPIQTGVQLKSSVSDSSADLLWNFGDGTTSQQRNPLHSYAEPGLYNVSLTAIGSAQNCSKTSAKTEYIQVVGRTISGQILADGSGLENCLVSLWYNQTRMLSYAVTDETGAYTLNHLPAQSGLVLSILPPQSVRDKYMLQYYPDATLWSDAELLSTLNQDLTLNIDLIEPPNNGFCGLVTDGIQGIANAQISIFSESLGLARSVTADDNGLYSVTGLPSASDYVVSAWLSTINQEYYYAVAEGLTPGESLPESSVTRYTRATPIQPDSPCLQNINIIMNNAQIIGSVQSDGKPLSNVWVNAWSSELHCSNGSTTDTNGRYTITGLIGVDANNALTKGYLVELQSSGYPYQVFDNQSNAEQGTRVETGRQDIDFELFNNRQLTGRVTNMNGLPLANSYVKIASDQIDSTADTYADENGYYTFAKLPLASDYVLYAYSNGYPLQYYMNAISESQAEEINLFNGNASDINFVLDKGAIIYGNVSYLESGQSVGEGIWVNIWSESQKSGGDVPTDSNGNYEISGLNANADDYIVSIWHQDYLNVFYSANGMVYQYTAATQISPSDQSRDLVLTPGFCIQGLITYLNEPLADILVWADGSTTGMTTSFVPGINSSNYSVCGLAPGSYEVNVSSDQYMDATYGDPVVIDAANISNIDFQMTVPTRILKGSIYNADKDEKISVFAWSQSTDWQEIVWLTGTGEIIEYEFGNLKPASDYRLEIRPNNHENQIYNNKTDWNDADIIDLSAENASGIDITLTSSPGKITGHVVFPEPLVENDPVWITAFSETYNHQKNIVVYPETGGSVEYTLSALIRTNDYVVYLSSDIYEQQYYPGAKKLENAQYINTLDNQPDELINFTVTPGGSISGKVFNAQNQPISNIFVMVWSDQLSMGATGETDDNGNYQVKGLNAASDYVVLIQDDTTTFYYNSDGTVVQSNKKGFVTLSAGAAVTGINLTMIDGDQVNGTVRNSEGSSIANVWISAWSESLESGGSCFTNSQGQYLIKNLLSGHDYSVEAIPASSLGYFSQIKTNVQSNAAQVDFILQKGFSLSGQIRSSNQSPLVNVVFEISSISQSIYQNDTSDSLGNFKIQGLPSSSDYIIKATPPNDMHLTFFEDQNFMIDDDTTLNITLSSALTISGTVQVSVNDTSQSYTGCARINVYGSNGFDEWTSSDSQGNFILYHVPDATDYEIKIYADNYADQTLYQVAAGDNLTIVLSEGKSIQGEVKNSRGQAVSNARVEVFSAMINLTKSTITNSDGSFIIDGLPEYNNASSVDDYLLRVNANNYPEIRKNNVQPGDTVSIVLDADESLFISGTVADIANNSIPNGSSIVVRLYESMDNNDNTKMLSKQTIDSQGTYLFIGLDANKQYKLMFKQIDGSQEKLKEWAGENNIGVEKKKDAILYSPGQVVNFQFSEVWH
ncbi:PKD domain protein, partial [Candidatus Magnetomorum sp. HK-1]